MLVRTIFGCVLCAIDLGIIESQPDESEIRDRQNEYERCRWILRNTKRLFSALDDMGRAVKTLKENLKNELKNKEDNTCE